MPRDTDLWMHTLALGSRVHVHNFRVRRGWTQEEAAGWYGCDVRSWQRYESGERRVPAPLLRRIDQYNQRRPHDAARAS